MSESTGRPNQGYLFPNKKAHDRQPDFRGRVNVAGTDYLLSGWVRPKDGEEMISLSVTDPADLPPRGSSGGGSQKASAPTSQSSSGAPPAAGGGVGNIFDDLPG